MDLFLPIVKVGIGFAKVYSSRSATERYPGTDTTDYDNNKQPPPTTPWSNLTSMEFYIWSNARLMHKIITTSTAAPPPKLINWIKFLDNSIFSRRSNGRGRFVFFFRCSCSDNHELTVCSIRGSKQRCVQSGNIRRSVITARNEIFSGQRRSRFKKKKTVPFSVFYRLIATWGMAERFKRIKKLAKPFRSLK